MAGVVKLKVSWKCAVAGGWVPRRRVRATNKTSRGSKAERGRSDCIPGSGGLPAVAACYSFSCTLQVWFDDNKNSLPELRQYAGGADIIISNFLLTWMNMFLFQIQKWLFLFILYKCEEKHPTILPQCSFEREEKASQICGIILILSKIHIWSISIFGAFIWYWVAHMYLIR